MIFTSNLSTKERKEKEEDLRTLRYKLAISNTIFFFFFFSLVLMWHVVVLVMNPCESD